MCKLGSEDSRQGPMLRYGTDGNNPCGFKEDREFYT